MKTRNNRVYVGFLLNLQEEFAGVVARVESLRGRMSEAGRQASCRVYRDIEGLFESLLVLSFAEGLAESFG